MSVPMIATGLRMKKFCIFTARCAVRGIHSFCTGIPVVVNQALPRLNFMHTVLGPFLSEFFWYHRIRYQMIRVAGKYQLIFCFVSVGGIKVSRRLMVCNSFNT